MADDLIQKLKSSDRCSEIFLNWAVCIAREHLWEHMRQECLLEDPVEPWGDVTLRRSLNQFFDRAMYFTLVGYQTAIKDELASAALFPQR